MLPQERSEVLDKAVSFLAEHFDSVQILATRCEGTETESYACGVGNFMARMGQVQEFLRREELRLFAELVKRRGKK